MNINTNAFQFKPGSWSLGPAKYTIYRYISDPGPPRTDLTHVPFTEEKPYLLLLSQEQKNICLQINILNIVFYL